MVSEGFRQVSASFGGFRWCVAGGFDGVSRRFIEVTACFNMLQRNSGDLRGCHRSFRRISVTVQRVSLSYRRGGGDRVSGAVYL